MTDAVHLPLTDEIVLSVVNNINVTFDDLDALVFSFWNMGEYCNPLVDVVLAKQGEVALR